MSTNHIKRLRNEYIEAERRLLAAVEDVCPDLHEPRRHRDLNPAWCPQCGRTKFGLLVGEPR